MDDEYEIFPHQLLEDLKYDVEALKKKLSEPETATHELLTEIENLKISLKELTSLFKEALQEIKEEDSVKLLLSLQNKVEAVTTQNETIARGLVAISDKLEDFMKKSSPSQQPFPKVSRNLPPPLNSPNFNAPPGQIPPFGPLPPPPPLDFSLSAEKKPKRLGLFK